jgi:DNA polymerase III delta prime subunit
MLPIHKEINKKLDVFIEKNRVPHIIFHGPYGSGKKTIVRNFLKKIYRNEESNLKDYVMYVDCAQGKGIKFVRDDIKFFAKTNIKNNIFKSIVFLNTDKLTMDAQSALRRCIELFSHSTRFFIILEDKYKLLKPISSRFCEFYVGLPKIKNNTISLHENIVNNIYNTNDEKKRIEYIQKTLVQLKKALSNNSDLKLYDVVERFYNRGLSGLDLIKTIEKTRMFDENEKIEYLFLFNDAKKEFRNEKTFMMFMLSILFLRNKCSLENITFM